MHRISSPEGGEVPLGDVVPRRDGGGRADHLEVFYSLPAGEVFDPPVDVAKLGAHGVAVSFLTKVGNMPDVRTAFCGAVPG